MVVKSSFLVGFDSSVDDQQGETRERWGCKNFPFNGPSLLRAGVSPRPHWIRPLKEKFFFCEVPLNLPLKNIMLEVVIHALQAAFWVAAGGRSFLPPTNLLPLFRPTSRDYSHTMCASHLYVSTILHFYKRQCWIYILNPGSLWTGNKNGAFFGIQARAHSIVLWAEELKHFWSWSAWVGRSQPSILHLRWWWWWW